MEREKFIEKWKTEEENAKISGWDFSYLNGRFSEDTSFPWDYKKTVLKYLSPEKKLLDIDTGGGEFLLSLGHPLNNCAATENFSPNILLCEEKLLPLGINFKKGPADALPFDDNCFDIVINRHGSFCPYEIRRVLKPGGIFITQQVGAENDRKFVKLLFQKEMPLPFPEQYLDITSEKFETAGFEILESAESKNPMMFYDVGALVWFAKIIEWEFPHFSVDLCLDGLFKAQRIVDKFGYIEGFTHRFFLVAKVLK